MTTQTDPRLQRFADYLLLPIEYSTELPEHVSGFLNLDSDCPSIVLNAHKPPCDHALTIGHEMAHYIMHQDGDRKFKVPWFLDRPWRWQLMKESAQDVKAFWLRTFTVEWEADLWAFLLLWHIGDIQYLMGIVELYPEKTGMLLYSRLALVLGGIKTSNKNFFEGFFRR